MENVQRLTAYHGVKPQVGKKRETTMSTVEDIVCSCVKAQAGVLSTPGGINDSTGQQERRFC